MVESPEACDDGNADDGDGCSADCELEEGWTCGDTQPTECTAPDLLVRIVSAVWTGDDLEVTYTVRNIGEVASGQYRVDVWGARAFDDPPYPTDAGDVTSTSRPSLDPGAVDMFVDTVPSVPTGDHVAFVIVDTDNELVELDDNNNNSLGHAWTTGNLTLHATFSPPETSVPIPDDGTPLVRSLEIATVSTAPQLFASVNITHIDVGELQLQLIAPNGATLLLFDGGASGRNFGGTTFAVDLVGGNTISDGSPPYIDEFLPQESWSETPAINGSWQLRVVDDTPGNAGRLNDWGVSLLEFDP
jgi:cysteine-rich repeat protein